MTRTFLFRAFLGSLGRLDIISRSVWVRITLFWNTGSMKGAISFGVPHEAFCQVGFLFMDAFSFRGGRYRQGKRVGNAPCGRSNAAFGVGSIKPLPARKTRRRGRQKPVFLRLPGAGKLSNA